MYRVYKELLGCNCPHRQTLDVNMTHDLVSSQRTNGPANLP